MYWLSYTTSTGALVSVQFATEEAANRRETSMRNLGATNFETREVN